MHELAHKCVEKRQQGEASKVTQALASRIRSLHSKLRKCLEEMYAWMAAADDDPHANVRLPESVVDGMLQGEPAPWHAGSQSSGVRLMFGRRSFMAFNDRQRCEEQLSVLPIERKRLVQWLEVMLQSVNERSRLIGEELGVHVAGGSSAPSRHGARQHGQLFWLQWHAGRLSMLLDEVEKKLQW